MKKYQLRALAPAMLLAATTTAGATSGSPFDGFYAGGSVGGSFANGDQEITQSGRITTGGTTLNVGSSSSRAVKRNAFTGALFLGFGNTWDPMYLGAEAFVKGTTRSSTKNSDGPFFSTATAAPVQTSTLSMATDTTTRFRPIEFGIDLRPGVLLRPETLLYARIGAMWGKLSAKSEMTVTGVTNQTPPPFPNFTVPLTQEGNKDRVNWRFGGGLEQQICDNWMVRADYATTPYRRVDFNNSLTDAATGGVLSNSTVVKNVWDHTVMLGVSYYWQ